MAFTLEQILALSPDDASAKAANALVAPGKWPTLALNAEAIWGECQGSGSKPYQVQIDLGGPAFRCSCPSRKFPCKHGLALFMLSVQHTPRFQEDSAPPPWVAEWLSSRRERAELQEAKAAEPSKATDPEAAARRETKRLERVQAGAAELELWLQDQVRAGLGVLEQADPASWNALAARMVDAQLPGLAQRIKTIAVLPRDRHWHDALLEELGRLQLLIEAFRHETALTAAERQDVRTALGIAATREDVLANGEHVSDDWLVVGVQLLERDRLWERQVWLQGQGTKRVALLLDFAHGEPRFTESWLCGLLAQGELVFYPSATPLRALAEGLQRVAGTRRRPTFFTLAQALEQLAQRCAANPWQPGQLLLLTAQTFVAQGTQWYLRDSEGRGLPLACSEEAAWQLLAVTGGWPADVAGVWDGQRLQLQSVWRDELRWTPGARA